MQVVKIKRENAAEILADKLKTALQNHPAVTWLLSGGSNIEISVGALNLLPNDLKAKLILAQTDERFGVPGHPDSNWLQLSRSGLKLDGLKGNYPILTNASLSLAATAQNYNRTLEQLFTTSYKLGQFGIGTDSHIAGIKPGTPATVATSLVTGYEAGDYLRVTMTFDAIKQLNEAYAFVFGEDKSIVLNDLNNSHHPLLSQPDQILKSVGNATLYNDQIGAED